MKNLIFIPYQDIYDFTNSKILTREYSMLKFFLDEDIKNIYFISKPRTLLDKKNLSNSNFPSNSVEQEILDIINSSSKFRYETIINPNLFFKKRGWWIEGYKKTLNLLKDKDIDYANTIVYSNNPFAYELLKELKKLGVKIYFDVMDNLTVHPSLSPKERKLAMGCYEQTFLLADLLTCNSESIVEFCEKEFLVTPILIKNGVFPINNRILIEDENIKNKLLELKKKKQEFKQSIGYVGKLGLRIDATLIKNLLEENEKKLFVFIGPHLSGQKNKQLIELFNNYDNIYHLGSIPSCYIYLFLNEFDFLMIPHAVGKYENGGDPLKLYQYLNTQKPIISTEISGVDEFEGLITIANDLNTWNSFFKQSLKNKNNEIPEEIFWNYRLAEVKKYIKNEESKII